MSTDKKKEMNGPNTIDSDRVIDQCMMSEKLIDITAKQLCGLRTQCSTSELTQKLICETESKLIKLFGKQLVAKSRLNTTVVPEKLHKYPSAEQWLHIVGINHSIVKSLSRRDLTMEQLLEMSDSEISKLMRHYNAVNEDVVRLSTALGHLKTWTDLQLHGDTKAFNVDMDLHWSSYSSGSGSPYSGTSPSFSSHSQRPSTSSLPPDLSATSSCHMPSPDSVPTSPIPYPSPAEHRKRLTPPPTPPITKTSSKGKFPTTPPPHRRNKLYPTNTFHPLTKSKSHESQLAVKVNQDTSTDISRYTMKKPENLNLANSQEIPQQRKPSYEYGDSGASGQTSPLISSPRPSPPSKTSDTLDDPSSVKRNQLVVPISPNTPIGTRVGNMKHAIAHRFQSKVILSTCDLCSKNVFRGKVCRECKAKYHKECAAKAAPACGLPQELLTLYLESLSTGDGSPNLVRRGSELSDQEGAPHPVYPGMDSSSTTSSCSSSTPSSPAVFMMSSSSPTSTPHPSPLIQITSDTTTQFHFPDVAMDTSSDCSRISSVVLDNGNFRADVVNTNTSNDSDKSDKTLIETCGSLERASLFDRADSQEIPEDGQQIWTRVNSISVTLKEWDIPFEELILDEEIGKGRFGTVFRGKWHGEVAIKMLKTDPGRDNQAQLQVFKLEIAMLRKTRHENLVLFMGACMKQPDLAIVTSLCRGSTLFTHIHLRREKFTINRSIIIASQIAQGMGYLHAKGIIHRDLKSKNIFLEGGKVIITDFGLFSVTKLCHGSRKGEWLSIPQGWLCYLAPEIMRALSAWGRIDRDLPFTEASDIYAFGTVWYELVAGEWPFRLQPPEVVIWQTGKGMKQSLSILQASRDVKDILMLCWDYSPDDRPDFATLLRTFDKLPKKRLARSPSHPIQLSRSAESVF